MTELLQRVANRDLFIKIINALNEDEINYIVDFSTKTNNKNLTILDDTETDIYVWNTEFNILKFHQTLKRFEYNTESNYVIIFENLAKINIYFLNIDESDQIKLKDIIVPKSLINKTQTTTLDLKTEILKMNRSANWVELLEYKDKYKKKSWWEFWGLR
jgi:hypothetical protein